MYFIIKDYGVFDLSAFSADSHKFSYPRQDKRYQSKFNAVFIFYVFYKNITLYSKKIKIINFYLLFR